MVIYITCFDISDDRLRSRAGKLLRCYGERVQKSVFEISVRNRDELEAIRLKLADMVEKGDNVRFYRLCATCRGASTTLNGEKVASFPAIVIV